MRDDRNDLIQILGMFAIRLAIAAGLLYAAWKRDLTLLPFAGAAAAFLMAKPLLEIGPALFGRLKVATYKEADHWLAYGGFTVRAYRDGRGQWWFDADDCCRLIDLRWPAVGEDAELTPRQRGRPVYSEAAVHRLLGGSDHPLAKRIAGWFGREMVALRTLGGGRGDAPPDAPVI